MQLLMWVSEQKFCCETYGAEFEASHLRPLESVREWAIEKSQKVIKDRVRDVYTINIALRDVDTPLIAFFCGENKAAAYQIAEAFSRMSEIRAGAGPQESTQTA
jgi:hypothetical protein